MRLKKRKHPTKNSHVLLDISYIKVMYYQSVNYRWNLITVFCRRIEGTNETVVLLCHKCNDWHHETWHECIPSSLTLCRSFKRDCFILFNLGPQLADKRSRSRSYLPNFEHLPAANPYLISCLDERHYLRQSLFWWGLLFPVTMALLGRQT